MTNEPKELLAFDEKILSTAGEVCMSKPARYFSLDEHVMSAHEVQDLIREVWDMAQYLEAQRHKSHHNPV